MNAFEYAAPKKLKDVAGLLGKDWNESAILAGGTDLVTALKQNLIAPRRVISLKDVPELKGIKSSERALAIGAMTTLDDLAAHAEVKALFPSLIAAVRGIGSPQLTCVGTVGGDLCQRPRCWYYRNGYGLLAQHGDQSLVREGDNRYHAIFGTDGPALFVNPSSLAPALVALGATIKLLGADGRSQTVAAREFFQSPKSEAERENVLKPDSIVTEVSIPKSGRKNATYEVRHRQGVDWPYVAASVALAVSGGMISNASVVLGHVAAVPWVSEAAASALNGKSASEATAARCGEAAASGAQPLSRNAYKIALVKTAVKRAVIAALA